MDCGLSRQRSVSAGVIESEIKQNDNFLLSEDETDCSEFIRPVPVPWERFKNESYHYGCRYIMNISFIF